MLQMLAHSLDKGSTNLENLTLSNCGCGDIGLVAFLDIINHESFPNLKHLILTNNNFCKLHLSISTYHSPLLHSSTHCSLKV